MKIRLFHVILTTKLEEMVHVHRLKSKVELLLLFYFIYLFIFLKSDVKIQHIMAIYKNQGGMSKRLVLMVVELSVQSLNSHT